jgi:hypothetical protein
MARKGRDSAKKSALKGEVEQILAEDQYLRKTFAADTL